MNEKDIIRSLSYIGDDLVSEAEDKKAKAHFRLLRSRQRRFTSVAACLLIATLIFPSAIFLTQLDSNNKGNDGQPPSLTDISDTESNRPNFGEDILLSILPTKNALELSAGYVSLFDKESSPPNSTAPADTTAGVPAVSTPGAVAPPKDTTVSELPIISPELYKEYTDVFLKFSLNTFRNSLGDRGENTVISPLSALTCLAMIANGADGDTRAEIERAVGCEIDELNEALRSYTKYICFNNSPIKSANSLWIKNTGGLKISEIFLKKNAYYYGAKVYSAPFDSKTPDEVNKWCEDSTGGAIKDLTKELSPQTVMLLINAMLFEDGWENEYTEKNIIKDFLFTNYDGSSSKVTALESFEKIYISDNGASGFVKNYADGRFSFALIVPKGDTDVYEYTANLRTDTWKALWASRQETTVAVIFPEFSCESETDLASTARKLGISLMFSPENADFSGIGALSSGRLYFDMFKQKASLSVDRNGSFGGAGSIGGGSESTGIKSVDAAKPFIYAIVDNETGLPIFMGCVADLG